jgi:hypothetical protein
VSVLKIYLRRDRDAAIGKRAEKKVFEGARILSQALKRDIFVAT